MNTPIEHSGRCSRRRAIAGATAFAIATVVNTSILEPTRATWEPRPPQIAGRLFVDKTADPARRSLTATVRDCETSWGAQQAAHDLFSKATAPITNMEESISEIYRQPLDDPYGIDGHWTIIAGAAGVASYHRGLFFAVDRLCWTLDAGRIEATDDHAFLVPLAGVLRDRFNALEKKQEIDLWTLLPEEDDLGGGFRLVKSFDHEDEMNP